VIAGAVSVIQQVRFLISKQFSCHACPTFANQAFITEVSKECFHRLQQDDDKSKESQVVDIFIAKRVTIGGAIIAVTVGPHLQQFKLTLPNKFLDDLPTRHPINWLQSLKGFVSR